ncbi:MAG TPA: ABC transporter substrate-binding protein [Acidocella sp.]|uniref:ABC transporter substrate-binding protein n=1 Tax=Acidocella sp. TaxID=50710 RepID=UPI002BE67FE2|nr:ABC transporter substrate-binding protein [Acidocella sp.]HVE22082.1 ABC transporter substrate-binding protein [Acidocella sp.]
MKSDSFSSNHRWLRTLLLLSVAVSAADVSVAHAQGVLKIGMTASDLPITTGNPDQGFEGYRFVGYNLYDSLVEWDLSSATKPSVLVPGLATSWHVDPNDNKRWIFNLRQGVKWDDGCPFVASDVVWNLAHLTDPKSAQYYAAEAAQASSYLTNYASSEAIDDHTVAITTKRVDSLFPYEISYILLVSPCRAKALNYNWQDFANHPSGTGPYLFSREIPHQEMDLVPNKNYWNKARIPKQDKVELFPMPDPATRTAALLSGQVNWIEAPDPDSARRLKAAGMQIITNTYPHNWDYQLNFVKSPFTDIRVRQAANYAINRADMKALLDGMMIEGYSTVPPSTPYYGHPVEYKFDPAKATALLKQAGCYPCNVVFGISSSGSGQMQSLSMNELVKEQLDAVGFNVKLDTMDWNQLLAVGRNGVDKYPNLSAINISHQSQDPFDALIRLVSTSQWAPHGSNWGHYSNKDADALITQIYGEFDAQKRTALLAKLNELMNVQAMQIFVAYDVNPRALSPNVHGFVQAQSWFQDITSVTISP